MDMTVIGMFVQAALEIYERHRTNTGVRLTKEQVMAQLKAEIASGQHAIAQWYAEHPEFDPPE